MYCRPKKVLPAIVCPTKCCVDHNFENVVQPVVHPTHTTTVNHTNVQQQHFFPHTQSVVNEVTHQNLGPAPGSVLGATSGPGSYPTQGMGMGPGGYPGSVAGATSGPYPTQGMGMGPGVSPGYGPKGHPGYGPSRRPGFFR